MDLLSKKQVLSLSTPLSEIKYMGRLSGVYFLINEGSIIYIGISEDIACRVRSHSYDTFKTFNRFSFLENSTYKGLRDLEYLYIRVFQPKHNKHHVDEKPTNGNLLSENEVSNAIKYLSYKDYSDISSRHYFTTYLLMKIMLGEKPYENSDNKRNAMVKEARELVKQRAVNALEVIEPKTL